MSDDVIWPGEVLTGASGKQYVIGRLIGSQEDTPCDAETPTMLDGRCRCIVCPRCDHHTGNAHQGHHWSYCTVTGTTREFHFCCPGDCELETP